MQKEIVKKVKFVTKSDAKFPIHRHFLEDALKAVTHTIIYHRCLLSTEIASEECNTLDIKYLVFKGKTNTGYDKVTSNVNKQLR